MWSSWSAVSLWCPDILKRPPLCFSLIIKLPASVPSPNGVGAFSAKRSTYPLSKQNCSFSKICGLITATLYAYKHRITGIRYFSEIFLAMCFYSLNHYWCLIVYVFSNWLASLDTVRSGYVERQFQKKKKKLWWKYFPCLIIPIDIKKYIKDIILLFRLCFLHW